MCATIGSPVTQGARLGIFDPQRLSRALLAEPSIAHAVSQQVDSQKANLNGSPAAAVKTHSEVASASKASMIVDTLAVLIE